MKMIRNVVQSLVTELSGKQNRRRFGSVCTTARLIDACENRILPALMTIPLKEFNGVHPTEHTDVNGTLFFVNDSFGSSGPVQLWKSDGTAAGTQVVKTLRTIRGSFPGFGELTNHNGTLYFAADDGVSGYELWKSDGTAAGTVRVKDITPGVEDTSIGGLVSAGGLLYFHAAVGSSQDAVLYRTDGTAAGTYPVTWLGHSLEPYASRSVGDRLLVDGSIPGTSGLWAVSASGVTPISTFVSGHGPSNNLGAGARIGNKLLFNRMGNDIINPTNELWASDGTASGTMLVKSLSGSIVEMNSAGASVYFVTQNSAFALANAFNSDTQLWRSDGTASGTVQLRNFGNLPLALNGSPLGGARVVGSNLFFLIKNTSGDTEVWRSTGTTAGTTRLKTVKTASNSSTASHGGKFYFLAQNDVFDINFNIDVFWSSDGTANGTQIVDELTPSVIETSYPYGLVPVGQSLYVLSSRGTRTNLHFAKNVVLTPPVLTQPAAITADARPTVSWNSVPDATGYSISVQNAGSSDPVYLTSVTTTSYRFTEPLSIGTHHVWVSSQFGDRLFSEYSPPRTFRVNTPVTTVAPVANQATYRPTVRWQFLQGASQYEVVIDNLTTKQNAVAQAITSDLSFTPTVNLSPGSYQFRVRGIDGDGNRALWSSLTPFTTIVPPNIAPVIGGFTGIGSFTENGASTLVAPAATLSDPDSANFAGGVLTAVISSNRSVGDTLALVNQPPGAGRITVAGDVVSYSGIAIGNVSGGSNGTPLSVNLNSNATPTALQALIRNISFRVNSENPSTAIRTIRVVVTDGDGGTSNQASRQISVVAVNDAPIIGGVTGIGSFTENGTSTLVAPAATLLDPDSADFASGVLTAVISSNRSAGDTLAIVNQPPGTGRITVAGNVVSYSGIAIGNVSGGSNGVPLSVALNSRATPAAVQMLIRNISFRVNSENPSTATRTIIVVMTDGDRGTSNQASRQISVVAVNDPPIISGVTGIGSFTENGTSTLVAPAATLSDPDSADFAGGVLTAVISSNRSVGDTLAIVNQPPGTGRITVAGNVVSYSGIAIGNVSGGSNGAPLSVALNSRATPAAVQMLIRNISFRVNSENPSTAIRTIIVVMTDGDRGTSNQAPKQINVVAVNDPPIISGVTAAVNYTRGRTPVRPALSAVVTDADNANFNGGILTVFSASGANSADRITFAGYLVDSLGRISRNGKLIGTRNANGGVGTTGLNIRLTANATIAELQLLVRSLLFETTATTAGSRILEFRLSDGTGGNASPVRTNIRVL